MYHIITNPLLVASFWGWTVAQLLKIIVVLLTKHKLDLSLIVSSGGMPSSHSALVMALATAAGRRWGLDSAPFAISLVLAGIVMYDAAGVRRAVSIQARIINRMVDEFLTSQNIKEEKLRELIGHTPIQVFAGALLGFIVAIIVV